MVNGQILITFECILTLNCFLFLVCLTGGCVWHYDSQAFLFSLANKPGWGPVKLPQTGVDSSNRRYSIRSCSRYGPLFGGPGGHDMYVASYASSNRGSQANLGYTYSPPSGYSHNSNFARTFLAGGSDLYFTPDEVETYYETTWEIKVGAEFCVQPTLFKW